MARFSRCGLFMLLMSPLLLVHAVENPKGKADIVAADEVVDPQAGDIFSYPRDYVAVQLLAVKKRQSVLEFLETNQLGDRHWGAARVGGEIWYVLLLGVYPDRTAAEKAVADMPTTNPRVQPWIRTFGPLKDAIMNGR